MLGQHVFKDKYCYLAVNCTTISGSNLRPRPQTKRAIWLIRFVIKFPEFTEVSSCYANYHTFGHFGTRGLAQSGLKFGCVLSNGMPQGFFFPGETPP